MAKILKMMKMLSPVTNQPILLSSQKILAEIALKNNYTSPYWLTRAQIRRAMNGEIKLGEIPTTISIFFDKILPFEMLERNEQERILTLFPPYFPLGVGVLHEKNEWLSFTSQKINSVLNPKAEPRKLFLCKDYVAVNNLGLKKEKYIDVRNLSTIDLYNSDQLVVPEKGFPLRGIALNSGGKRIPQPAHDILLATGILRRYHSPFWLTSAQLKMQNLSVISGKEDEYVLASTMAGHAVPLAVTHPIIYSFLEKLLLSSVILPATNTVSSLFMDNSIFIFNCAGWERVLSKMILKVFNFAKEDCNLWVNLDEAIFHLKPEMLKALGISSSNTMLDNIKKMLKDPSLCDLAVDLAIATQRKFFNAMVTDKPYCCNIRSRPIAIANGKLFGKMLEQRLFAVSIEKKYPNPVWVSYRTAKVLGVLIKPEELKNSVTLSEDRVEIDKFYNISDLEDSESILKKFPIDEEKLNFHYALYISWRSVMGVMRRKIMDEFMVKHNYKKRLWIPESEAIVHGFVPKKKAISLIISTSLSQNSSNRCKSRRRWFNAIQTTDPVKVIGLTTYFARPQGTF